MATKPKTQIMSHDDTVMSPITKASNVLFEDGKTAQDKLEDNVEKSFTPSVENSLPINRNGQIRMNQAMVERHQKQIDELQAIILANLVNNQYKQTLATLQYELSRV